MQRVERMTSERKVFICKLRKKLANASNVRSTLRRCGGAAIYCAIEARMKRRFYRAPLGLADDTFTCGRRTPIPTAFSLQARVELHAAPSAPEQPRQLALAGPTCEILIANGSMPSTDMQIAGTALAVVEENAEALKP
jgi:hypothetical protein